MDLMAMTEMFYGVCWPAYYFSSAQEMNSFDVAVCLVVQLALFVELCKTEDCFCCLC